MNSILIKAGIIGLIGIFTGYNHLSAKNPPSQPLKATWLLSHGWLDSEIIEFDKVAYPEDFQDWGNAFIFGENDTLMHRMFIPDGRGICGNGLLYLTDGSFRINKRGTKMTLHVKGGHMVEDRFEYKIKYKILALTEHSLILKKKKALVQKTESEYAVLP